MARLATALRRGLVVTCWMCLVGLPALADEPSTKPQETKPPQSKPQESPKQPESKPPEAKAQDPKAQPPPAPPVKAPDSKAPDAPPPVKAQDAKPPETKGQDAKPPETKGQDAKPPETKGQDTKPPETKGQDAKAPAPPAKASETKAPESKAPDALKPAGTPILAIKLALMADPRLFPYEINVDMNGDAVVLTGKVGSEPDKTAAAEIVQALEGVKSITNNLEIVKDLPHTLARKKDEIITQYVKERFGKSKTLETAHFDIKTEDGIVSLSGKTKFLVIALEAAEAARNVPGVKAVKSEGIRVEAGE